MTDRVISAPTLAARFAISVKGSLATLTRTPRASRRSKPLLPGPAGLAGWTALVVAILMGTMMWVDAWAIGLAKSLPYEVIYIVARITEFGKSGYFLIPLGVFVLVSLALMSAIAAPMARKVLASLIVRASYIFIAIALPGIVIQLFKRLIGRARPSDLGPFAYEPGSWQSALHSLPSGHSTTAFAAAVAISALWPRARPIIWTYAVVILLSRVIVSAHFPSDVLAGAGIGALAALAVRNWYAERGLAFAVTSAGRVRGMPGPSMRRIKKVARAMAGH